MKSRPEMARIGMLCLGALVLMVLVAVGWANADPAAVGTTAASFLDVGAGPRILGMGGATIGLGQDLAGGSWNAAALGWMKESSLMVSHAGLDNSSLQEWAAVGGRIGKSQTRWSLSGLFQGDGTFDGRDASNNSTGSFSASSFAVGLDLAQQFGGVVTLGVGAKSVNDKLGDVTGTGVTFDGGLMIHEGILGLGFAARNVGGQMKYSNGSYDFPSSYGFGGSLSHGGLTAAMDLNFPSSYYKDARFGLEWRWKEMLALRAGYRKEDGASDDPLTGPSFGLGAGRNGFWLDYGYLVAGNGNGEHRLAITLFPGQWSSGSDPFGKGDIPRDFDSKPSAADAQLYGPPAPKTKGKTKP